MVGRTFGQPMSNTQAAERYVPNHTVDPKTGFLESSGFAYDFDGERKTMFIRRLVANGLSIYDTCDELGLSHHTVFKHYRNDQAFKLAVDEARRDYADRLDGVSKRNAMNPRSVIERIFQLKSLFPEKYADQKSSGNVQVNLTLDGNALALIKKREEVIDAEIIDNQSAESAKCSTGALTTDNAGLTTE